MIAVLLFVALLATFAESRVTFPTSEVLDDVDLRGTNTAAFLCKGGCRVYSPSRMDKIVIMDSAGKKWASLMDLGNLKTGEFFELPANEKEYTLTNQGGANPSFLLYIVQKGALNYNTKVLYLLSASRITVRPTTDSLRTVLSTSGAIRFTSFIGDFSDALPSVYTAGFDSINTCRPVYNAISAKSMEKTSFPVYSPIATIDFKKAAEGKSVLITGEAYVLTATGEDATSVYVSPGYVGCPSVGDSLYTSLPQITSFDSSFSAKDSNGISVVVDGDYSIANKADALTVTVNKDVQELYGKKSDYSKIYYDANSVQIAVKWTKKEGSKDYFALQIDVMSKDGAGNVQTTTKGGSYYTISAMFASLVIMLCL